MNTISMCIPRMESKYNASFIHNIFKNLNIGDIIDIIEVPNKNNNNFKKVMININTNNEIINKRFSEGKDIKIIYDNPWYWKIYQTK